MGRTKRLNRFIRKWIKSDLPDDHSSSTVLLLGVTKVPTSPLPSARRSQPPKDLDCDRRQSVRRRPISLPFFGQSTTTRGTCRSDGDENEELVVEDVVITRPLSVVVGGGVGDCLNDEKVVVVTPMDRSVDSIGTCSLDVDGSADVPDWQTDASSTDTLRSTICTNKPPSCVTEPHLPSYLSLACTVSGYTTSTNYDPIRLTKSRDASPHRPTDQHQSTNDQQLTTTTQTAYTIRNNLLSPLNLVPLPSRTTNPTLDQSGISMTDHAITQRHHHHHHSTYHTAYTPGEGGANDTSTTTTTTTTSQFYRDAIDACYQSNRNVQYMAATSMNGQTKSRTIIEQRHHHLQYTNGVIETKSFIQQRVERLYGPGALAQGFFVTKRQHNERQNRTFPTDVGVIEGGNLKQSTSSPTLPVLRHLRPEFRAQLPILGKKKSQDDDVGTSGSSNGSGMSKSSTVPTLKEEVINGHAQQNGVATESTNGDLTGEKDGHHFMKILDNETTRLLKLADLAENELENVELSEEIIGKIRSAAGKARLLVSQKMQQFRGLCRNNVMQVQGEAFPTTNEDLQGFWDMVMLQVDQVDNLFKELDQLKANGWREINVVTKNKSNGTINNKVKKMTKRPTSAPNEEMRKQRELQRKQMIEERRKAMKAQRQEKEDIEIFVPESS